MTKAARAALGRRVMCYRRKAGVTTSELAKATGLRVSTVWSIEHGRAQPRAHTLLTIADALGVNIRILITGAMFRVAQDLSAREVRAPDTLDLPPSHQDCPYCLTIGRATPPQEQTG